MYIDILKTSRMISIVNTVVPSVILITLTYNILKCISNLLTILKNLDELKKRFQLLNAKTTEYLTLNTN